MTPRERKALGGTSAITPTPNALATLPQRNGAPVNGHRIAAWEEWCRCASEAQRKEILALAQKQGLIYSHQLPVPANGVHHKTPPFETSPNEIVAQILAGKFDQLRPVAADAIAFMDGQLDARECEAVARALFSPDVFLLQGSPGISISAVLAEILQQTTTRGERVLLLANRAAALDAVLALLKDSQSVFTVRFQGPGENPPSPEIIPFTLANRRQAFAHQTLEGAIAARLEADARMARRQAEEPIWDPLRRLVADIGTIGLRHQGCRESLNNLTEKVQIEATGSKSSGPFISAFVPVTRTRDDGVATLKQINAEIESQLEATQKSRVEVERAVEALRPLAEAKQRGRWWSYTWWQAIRRGKVLATMTELQNRLTDLRETLNSLEKKQKENDHKQRQLEAWFTTETARLLAGEVERRRMDGEKQLGEMDREIARLNNDWQTQLHRLEQPKHRPHEPSPQAVEDARQQWEIQRQHDIQASKFAERWENYVTQAGAQLAVRLPEWANVLAGTLTALGTERSFADHAVGPLDLVVLLDANQFSEAEIGRVARHGMRLLLVAPTNNPSDPPKIHVPNGARGAAKGSAASRPSYFQMLWQNLHCDSRRLHYAWTREKERLCCTLRPVSAQDRGYIEIERVADFPEIELRILARPKAPPQLAQVVFPAAMNILQAKEFIYRELEEVAVHVQEDGAWLGDEAERFLFHLSPTSLSETVALNLGHGLREWVAPTTGNTCCLEFTKSAGWTRPQVDQWLDRHLQVRDLGRTLVLSDAAR